MMTIPAGNLPYVLTIHHLLAMQLSVEVDYRLKKGAMHNAGNL